MSLISVPIESPYVKLRYIALRYAMLCIVLNIVHMLQQLLFMLWFYFIFFLLYSGGQLDGCYALSGNLPRMWTFVLYDLFVPIRVANSSLSLSLPLTTYTIPMVLTKYTKIQYENQINWAAF